MLLALVEAGVDFSVDGFLVNLFFIPQRSPLPGFFLKESSSLRYFTINAFMEDAYQSLKFPIANLASSSGVDKFDIGDAFNAEELLFTANDQ